MNRKTNIVPDTASAVGGVRKKQLMLLDFAAAAAFTVGILCTGFFVLAKADQHIAGEAAVSAFIAAREAALDLEPDQANWSENRRSGFQESLDAGVSAPSGLLTIPSIDLTVPVFDGTDELILNRGVGWIESTARPGTTGNVGLAGHRDGYFRALQHLEVGSPIELQTIDGTSQYRVSEILIVYPEDVFVLDPTDEPTVTLVTCYPFYFVGHAPQRYIVRGVLDSQET